MKNFTPHIPNTEHAHTHTHIPQIVCIHAFVMTVNKEDGFSCLQHNVVAQLTRYINMIMANHQTGLRAGRKTKAVTRILTNDTNFFWSILILQQ